MRETAFFIAAALLMMAGRVRTGRALTLGAHSALRTLALLPMDRLVHIPLESRFPADPRLDTRDQRWALVMSAFHMPRAVACSARRAGA